MSASQSGGGMRLVVVESPYAGDVERNLAYLRAAMARDPDDLA